MVEHKKIGCVWSSARVIPCGMGQTFFPLALSDVVVCFGCIGSEFLLIVVGLPGLKMLWNKYTKSCTHS